MSFLEWDSSLDVNVDEMNGEHKTWIGYINNLHDLVKSDASSSVIIGAFEKMHAFLKEHFKHEEQLLKTINYPLVDDHIAAHEDFLAEMIRAKSRMITTGTLDDEFFRKLQGWLVRHIRIVDTQYGEYTRKLKRAS